MVKLIGKKKIPCAVFISGRGSNLKSIFNYSKKKRSIFHVKLVISNKSKVLGVRFAKNNKIETIVVNYKNKKRAEEQILKYLKKNKIKLVCLAGFMKILSKNFIKYFKNKIINIHPSLLPKYKGLNTFRRAIKNKEKLSGCSVHYVNKKLDSGKVILQKKVIISKNDTESSLKKKIQKEEYRAYSEAIRKVFSNISS